MFMGNFPLKSGNPFVRWSNRSQILLQYLPPSSDRTRGVTSGVYRRCRGSGGHLKATISRRSCPRPQRRAPLASVIYRTCPSYQNGATLDFQKFINSHINIINIVNIINVSMFQPCFFFGKGGLSCPIFSWENLAEVTTQTAPSSGNKLYDSDLEKPRVSGGDGFVWKCGVNIPNEIAI